MLRFIESDPRVLGELLSLDGLSDIPADGHWLLAHLAMSVNIGLATPLRPAVWAAHSSGMDADRALVLLAQLHEHGFVEVDTDYGQVCLPRMLHLSTLPRRIPDWARSFGQRAITVVASPALLLVLAATIEMISDDPTTSAKCRAGLQDSLAVLRAKLDALPEPVLA